MKCWRKCAQTSEQASAFAHLHQFIFIVQCACPVLYSHEWNVINIKWIELVSINRSYRNGNNSNMLKCQLDKLCARNSSAQWNRNVSTNVVTSLFLLSHYHHHHDCGLACLPLIHLLFFFHIIITSSRYLTFLIDISIGSCAMK